jgi:hypothetical protein
MHFTLIFLEKSTIALLLGSIGLTVIFHNRIQGALSINYPDLQGLAA